MESSTQVMLTIICYTYNHEQYIRQTLDGFVNQKTSFKFKAIVHDDASTDGTASIVQEYAKKYPDIIKPILQKENTYKTIGTRKRFQKYILPEIEGEYVAFCEGDDYWVSDSKLERQVAYLETHSECSACVHNSVFFNMNTNEKKAFNPSDASERDFTLKDVVNGIYQVFHFSSLVYRREYIEVRPSYFDAAGFGDYPRAIQLSLVGKIHYFPQKWSVYRFCSNPTSWTANNTGLKNVKKRISLIDREIAMLTIVKAEVPQYAEIIDESISRKQYDKYYLSGDAYNIRAKDNFYTMYRKESLIRKMKFQMRKLLLCDIRKNNNE